MFTGIIQGTAQISKFYSQPGSYRLILEVAQSELLHSLSIGASVSVDGICLTVVEIGTQSITFDVIDITYKDTNLKTRKPGDIVNIERAACFGDEIGGHLLSGHIHTTATVLTVRQTNEQTILECQVPEKWIQYIFTKGFIALNGTSLTVQAVNKQQHYFDVHLIPETLRTTNFQTKTPALLNVEIDQQTFTIVNTLSNIIADNLDINQIMSKHAQKLQTHTD